MEEKAYRNVISFALRLYMYMICNPLLNLKTGIIENMAYNSEEGKRQETLARITTEYVTKLRPNGRSFSVDSRAPHFYKYDAPSQYPCLLFSNTYPLL